MSTPVKQLFKAILENPDSSMDTAYVSMPFDVEKICGTRGQVKVKACFKRLEAAIEKLLAGKKNPFEK
jgi:hypothetical protein